MAVDNVGVFALLVEDLARLFPVSVTSWFRSRAHNAKVGGKPTSKHLQGLAVDLVLDPGVDKVRLITTARAWGLAVLDEGDHLHVQWMSPARVELTPTPPFSQAGGAPEGGATGGGDTASAPEGPPIQSEKI